MKIPYQKVALNNLYQDEHKTTQLENWSILSDSVRYVQHDERSKTTQARYKYFRLLPT